MGMSLGHSTAKVEDARARAVKSRD